MAFPVILIDSATGSDSAASGAGPATALTGSTGVSAADGLTINLIADAPDLSGVATDGSAVIYFVDATAGNRNFSAITAVNNTTKVVTVANAFGFTLTKAWAIGGKRASLFGAVSVKLLENNSASGDAMPGWTMQFASGHTESFSTGVTLRRPGNSAIGLITIQGVNGYSTRPVITCTGTSAVFTASTSGADITFWAFRRMEIAQSNGTPGRTFTGGGFSAILEDIKVDGSANIVIAGNVSNAVGQWWLYNCYLKTAHASANCISGNSYNIYSFGSYIRSVNGSGIAIDSSTAILVETIIDRCNIGISLSNGGGSLPTVWAFNTLVYGCTSSGVNYSAAVPSGGFGAQWINCGFISNGAYGINFNTSSTDMLLQTAHVIALNCGFYNNTSGDTNPASLPLTVIGATTGSDPGLVAPTSGNFMLGNSAWKAKGYPLGGTLPIGTITATYSYPDIGAAQHQDSGGGSSIGAQIFGG